MKTAALSKLWTPADEDLYINALQYFVDSYTGDQATEEEEKQCIKNVLRLIKRKQILEPLQVIDIVSTNPKAPFGLIKSYITNQLKAEEKNTADDEVIVQGLRKETQRYREQEADFRKKLSQLQRDGAKAGKDKSAYRSMVYGSTTLTADEEQALEQKSQRQRKARKPERFREELSTSADRMETVTEYFKHGLFDKEALEHDSGDSD